MLATAADAHFLAGSMQSSIPLLCRQRLQSKAAHSEVMATLAVCLLGHWIYSTACAWGGVYRLFAPWICLELAFFAWNRWRYAPRPSNVPHG
jgi:hypothetical protein